MDISQLKIKAAAAGWQVKINTKAVTSRNRQAMLGVRPPGNAGKIRIIASRQNINRQRNIKYNAVDLRDRGLVSQIKDQRDCGSCVAFATIAAMETSLLNDNNKTLLSEANLFFCNYEYGKPTCYEGWYIEDAIAAVTHNGVCSEAEQPYTGSAINDECPTRTKAQYKITNTVRLTSVSDMQAALDNNQALITYFAVYNDFWHYGGGVYRRVGDEIEGYHAVTIVGYGDDHWIVKNSWGSSWGEQGFFKIAYGECGIDAEIYTFGSVVKDRAERRRDNAKNQTKQFNRSPGRIHRQSKDQSCCDSCNAHRPIRAVSKPLSINWTLSKATLLWCLLWTIGACVGVFLPGVINFYLYLAMIVLFIFWR